VAFTTQSGGGDISSAFEHADRIIRLRVVNQRLAPSSIEPRVCMFDYDSASGELTAWMSSQAIYRARDTLAAFLNLDPGHIKVHNAEVGGAFGAKNALSGEEIIAAALAIRYGRPVKWIESRSDNLQAQTQGRGQVNYIEAAVKNDGQLLGLKVRSIADLGAFLSGLSAMIAQRMPSFLSGPYQVQAVDSQVVGVFTNKVPTAPYRGAGRPEAAYILERTMDCIAHELNLDPVEVRRRNFISGECSIITWQKPRYMAHSPRASDRLSTKRSSTTLTVSCSQARCWIIPYQSRRKSQILSLISSRLLRRSIPWV
jgi:carbon-monoxide dehydrogenase large subunit